MKKIVKSTLVAIAAVAMVSCVEEKIADQTGISITKVFTAYSDADIPEDIAPELRTTLHEDQRSVHWSESDDILVFSTTTKGVVSEGTTVHSDKRVADFAVNTTLADTYYALYPPQENATYSPKTNEITANIPTVQPLVANSFADNVNLSMARSGDDYLYFRNVGALLAIKCPTDFASSVKIVSRNPNVKMTGDITFTYNDGDPRIVSYGENAVNYVTFPAELLNSKDNIYNFIVCPGQYTDGFDVIFQSGYLPYLSAIYSNKTELDLHRNQNYLLFSLPDGVFNWNSISGPTSVSAEADGWGKAKVSWTWNYKVGTDYEYGEPRKGYKVYVRKSGTTEIIKTVDISDINTFTCDVTGLTVDNYYDFGVQVCKTISAPNVAVKDSEIVWAEKIWLQGNRCITPTPLLIEQINETQVTLTWKDNTGAEGNYKIWKTIYYPNGDIVTHVSDPLLAANTTTYTTGVELGCSYKFGIHAIHTSDSNLNSEIAYFDPYETLTWLELQYVDMGADECYAPYNVSVSLNANQQPTVSWKCDSGVATGYKIYIRESTETEWKQGVTATYTSTGVLPKTQTTYSFSKVLEPGKKYIIGVQAIHSTSASRNSIIVETEVMAVTTTTELYAWESARTGVPTFADMTLCYGGNTSRSPYLWDKERFASHAVYTDGSGQKHWFFDAFLALETHMYDGYSDRIFSISAGGEWSARRDEWTKLINYWFDGTYGFQALDDCIADAAKEIGAPSRKRYVIFVLPDPIYCKIFADKTSGTKYWGQYDNGEEADFSTVSGRVTAYQWMIDQVRARFAAKNYRHIELAGFYILSETLSEQYNSEYKKFKSVLTQVATYCHRYKEGLYWIPYGYTITGDSDHDATMIDWKSYGFDLAVLQPNKYWDYEDKRSWSKTFKSFINKYSMGMELEFEGSHGEALSKCSSILSYKKDGSENSEAYNNRQLLREYFQNAKDYGVYGSRPIVLYSGTNGMHELATSTAEKDVIIYRELGDFIINSSLKK